MHPPYLTQKLLPAHATDPKVSHAKLMIQHQKERCLHCGEPLHNGVFITYTQLANTKVIWWHRAHTINDFNE